MSCSRRGVIYYKFSIFNLGACIYKRHVFNILNFYSTRTLFGFKVPLVLYLNVPLVLTS